MYETFVAAQRAGQQSPLDNFPGIAPGLAPYWRVYMDCSSQRDFNGAVRYEAVRVYLDETGMRGEERRFAFNLVIELDAHQRAFAKKHRIKETIVART